MSGAEIVGLIVSMLGAVESLRKLAAAQGYTPAQLQAAVDKRTAEIDAKVSAAEAAEAEVIKG